MISSFSALLARHRWSNMSTSYLGNLTPLFLRRTQAHLTTSWSLRRCCCSRSVAPFLHSTGSLHSRHCSSCATISCLRFWNRYFWTFIHIEQQMRKSRLTQNWPKLLAFQWKVFIEICETLNENKGNMCLVDSGSPNIERLGQGYTHCTLVDKVENPKYRSLLPSHDGYF